MLSGGASSAATIAPTVPQATSGVLSYPASWFAAAQPNTAHDMIDRLPGFTFYDGSNARGFESAAGNVLVNGQLPTSKTDDLDSLLSRIPAGQVSRIDVIRGSAPGIDMHGKSLVANVILGARPTASLVMSATERSMPKDGRQGADVNLQGTWRRDGTSLEGSLLLQKTLDDNAGEGHVAQTGPGGARQGLAGDDVKAGGYQVTATGAYEHPLQGGKFRANLSLQAQPYSNDETVGAQGEPSIAPSAEHDRQHTYHGEFDLHYSRDLGPKLSMEVLAIQQLTSEDYLSLYDTPGDDERFAEKHSNGETIGRGVATWRPETKLTFEIGAETAYNWLTSRATYTTDAATVTLPAASVQIDELRGEAFIKATWAASPTLNTELGVRMEVSHLTSTGDVVLSKTLSYPKPRLAIAWSPTADDQIRVRLEREVGQLDFNDFVPASSLSTGHILVGNPNLTPQQAWVIEAAYERSFLTDGAATLTVRHSALSDIIDRAPVIIASGAFDAPANIGGGGEDELIADVNLPLGKFGVSGGLIKANLTWRRSQAVDPTTGARRSISGVTPFEGTIDFSQDLPRWKLTWGVEFDVGSIRRSYLFNQIETDTLAPFGSVYVEARPITGLSLRLGVDDIGNRFDRKLANWTYLRLLNLPYDDLQDRVLTRGPQAVVTLRWVL